MTKSLSFLKIFILIIFLVLPAVRFLLVRGYFPMHDDIQAFRLLEMDKCVRDSQIPCRWVPDMGYGYGYPQFNYYAPLPYYIMEIFHLFGFGFLDSTKIGFALSVFVSAFGMYLLASEFLGRIGGLISSVFYIYAPYRAVNIFVRGAMGEAWGMAFLPFIFWSSYQVIKGKRNSLLWLALSVFALFTSHNITALMFVPFYLVWILFLIFGEVKTDLILKLKNLFLANFWGFMMSAFFVLPAFFEKKYVHIETITMGYFDYLAHFAGLRQLLFSTKFDYGVSELGPNDSMLISPGILLWSFPLFVFLVLLFQVFVNNVIFNKRERRVQKDKLIEPGRRGGQGALGSLLGLFLGKDVKIKKSFDLRLFLLSLFLAWFALFLIHPRSVFIWRMIPILSYVQFPWRFLAISSFFFSLACGFVVLVLPKAFRPFSFLVVLALVLTFYLGYFKPREIINITDKDKFSGDAWQKQLTISIFDYLPKSAKHPPTQKAPDQPVFESGGGSILKGNKGTNWQEWRVNVSEDYSRIIFPLYNFPYWNVFVNGKRFSFTDDNDLGLITVVLNKGEYNVYLKLVDTPLRKYSNLFSLVSFLLIPLYVFKNRESRQNL